MAAKEETLLSEQRDSLLRDYNKQSSEENDADVPQPPQLHIQSRAHRTRRFHSLIIFLLLATSGVIAVIFIGIFAKSQGPHHHFRPLNASANPGESFTESIDCGRTAAEARERGCIFDLMLSTWIHESCSDRELMNKYLLEGNYTYYYDENMEHQMPEEEVWRGEYRTIWTQAEFHFRHCVYLMDMQLRSYKTGRPIEVSIYNFGHTDHCVNLTLGPDWRGRMTRLHALVGKCGFPKMT